MYEDPEISVSVEAVARLLLGNASSRGFAVSLCDRSRVKAKADPPPSVAGVAVSFTGELRGASARDQPGALERLLVLRARRHSDRERLSQPVRRLA